jgi:hypothetical protein
MMGISMNTKELEKKGIIGKLEGFEIYKPVYHLPRSYLSYSAFTLWQKDKDAYRRKYYLGEPSFENAETIFGKKTAEHLEDNEIEGVIVYDTREYRIEVELEEGLKLLGYLDRFNSPTLSILEIKTGHLDSKGKVPWDKIKVQKHKQLVFYSLLVKLKHGKVDPVTILQWLETKFQKESREFGGHVMEAETKKLELTGRIETFKRRIYKWEIDKMKEEIISVAKEISNDYTQWKKNQ